MRNTFIDIDLSSMIFPSFVSELYARFVLARLIFVSFYSATCALRVLARLERPAEEIVGDGRLPLCGFSTIPM